MQVVQVIRLPEMFQQIGSQADCFLRMACVGQQRSQPPKVDFVGIAKSLGMEATRVTEPGELNSAFKSAFSRPGAKLIEVMVDGKV